MTRIEKIALPFAIVLIGVSAWLHIMLPAESDKGWLLHAARMWLEGGRLYVDIIEVNPPLIVWFYAIPVWLSMHVPHLSDFEALGFIGLVLSALSIAVCTRLIKLHPAFAGDMFAQARFAIMLALIFIFYTTQPYFFDRDHILLVFAFPYILRFMPSLSRQKLSLRMQLTIGAMAAAGFCIKPHTIIVFAALQLFIMWQQRSKMAVLNVENAVIAGLSLLYALLILIFTPEYVSTIVPLAIATYSEFGSTSSRRFYIPPALICAGLIFADFRARYSTPFRRDVLYWAYICIAFLLYAYLQNGWGYTYNPLYCVLMMTAGWMLWEYGWLKHQQEARGLPTDQIQCGIRGCAIVLLLNAAYVLIYLLAMSTQVKSIRMPCDGNPDCWRSGTFTEYMHMHDRHSFGTISFDFSNWVYLLRTSGAHWDTRFNHVWMLLKPIDEGEAYGTKYAWVIDYVGKGLGEDMDRKKPAVMFVDNSPGFMGRLRRVDMLAVLAQVPEFKLAWRHYRYDTTINGCKQINAVIPSECLYDIYVRKP